MGIFLEMHSEALDHFIKFKSLVQKRCGNPIKTLWTYNGGEYVSHDFEDFYRKHAIVRQFMVPLLLNKTKLQKGRIGLLLKCFNVCFMLKILICNCHEDHLPVTDDAAIDEDHDVVPLVDDASHKFNAKLIV